MTVPETSHLANKEMTSDIRKVHHDKIMAALEVLGEAIYEVIAEHCGMEKHQIGRRLKELVDAGKIYNTLKTGITTTGRKANKYAIRNSETILPTPEHHYREGECSASDYASELIAKTKQGIAIQKDLFGSSD